MASSSNQTAGDQPLPPAGMQGAPGPLLRLVRNQKVAFVLVGGVNTVVGFLFFVGFEVTIGRLWGYFASLAFAHVFSVLFAFVLYRRFVFRVHGHVLRDLGRFEVVYLVALGINFVLLPILVEVFGLQVIPAQALIVFVTALVSFFGHRGFSFRRSRGELEPDEQTLAAAGTAVASGPDGVPQVSVVIPAFNNEQFLVETIETVLGQDYPNFELIIADHCSTDGTAAIMHRYADDPRVRLFQTEAGGGAERNWNRVSRAANGTYLKLVCGDDLLYPGILTAQVAALQQHPEAVLAASPRDILDAAGKKLIRDRGLAGLVGRHSGDTAIRRTVRQGTNIFGEPGCVLIRLDALRAAGWWSTAATYLIDEATYVAVLGHGDFVGVPTTLAGFRVSAGQWSVQLARQQAAQVVAFHGELRRALPETISRADVRVGNARARVLALSRRLAYRVLAHRASGPTTQATPPNPHASGQLHSAPPHPPVPISPPAPAQTSPPSPARESRP
ncbi:glycosyltransferase [Homoserinimonas sp. OAct 916]|uniref:glycosyltransferase n=1 Tax=Homoserinimonas sp. OAct 916 TaxID=2211450 RepID=UPI001E5CA2CB|nr:glycosyltransferase [Homoserinimonas sp. OAct 916]